MRNGGQIRNADGSRLTKDQIRGFELACENLMLWGRQIEISGKNLGGDASKMVPQTEMMAHGGRMVSATAQALLMAVKK